MNNRLKETFDSIHAEEDLKNRTKDYVFQKTQGYKKNRSRAYVYKSLVPVAVCFLFVLIGLGGYHIYFTPTSVISIDINPSFELEVNRFDRVISIEGFNKDGDRLVESLNVRFLNYTEALKQILNNEDVETYLSRDELLSIAVIGSDKTRNEQMLSHIESCTAEHKNTHCSSAEAKDVEGAHESGLSCGKYKAFLELQALDPSITVEQVQGMTMREIRELIKTLSPSSSSEGADGTAAESGHNGGGDEHGESEDKHSGFKHGHFDGHD